MTDPLTAHDYVINSVERALRTAYGDVSDVWTDWSALIAEVRALREAPLDVERLARAITKAWEVPRPDPIGTGGSPMTDAEFAAAVARAYAALDRLDR